MWPRADRRSTHHWTGVIRCRVSYLVIGTQRVPSWRAFGRGCPHGVTARGVERAAPSINWWGCGRAGQGSWLAGSTGHPRRSIGGVADGLGRVLGWRRVAPLGDRVRAIGDPGAAVL